MKPFIEAALLQGRPPFQALRDAAALLSEAMRGSVDCTHGRSVRNVDRPITKQGDPAHAAAHAEAA